MKIVSLEQKKYFTIWLQMINSISDVSSNWKNKKTGFQHFIDDGYLAFMDSVNKYGLENVQLDRLNVNNGFNINNCQFIKHSVKKARFEGLYVENLLLIRFNNIKKFAQENNLKVKHINDCLESKKRETNGWIFRKTKK